MPRQGFMCAILAASWEGKLVKALSKQEFWGAPLIQSEASGRRFSEQSHTGWGLGLSKLSSII